jgi:hypothetical protein
LRARVEERVLLEWEEDGESTGRHYRKPPKPPLEGAAAEWADQLLKEKALR